MQSDTASDTPVPTPGDGLTPVFDGHNDVLLHLWLDAERRRRFLSGGNRGHLDLPRGRAGGLVGGLFAIFTPGGMSIKDLERLARETDAGAAIPPADPTQALHDALAMVAVLLRLIRGADGQLSIARTSSEIRTLMDADCVAVMLHLEGAEAIDADHLDALEVLWELGLRSLGLTWSRPNAFAHGVPLRFPSTGDIGPGLTKAGRRLVRLCNELGVMIDLAHLNHRGFWDVARLSKAPLVVTHTGVHALAPSSRNLTDAQLDAVAAAGGVVGITFNTSDLRADGKRDPNTSIDVLVQHIDYVAQRTGLDHVAFGSDFDGATVPQELHDVAGLPLVIERLRAHGYGQDAIAKIAHENWLRALSASRG